MSGSEFAKYCLVLRKLMCKSGDFFKYFPEQRNNVSGYIFSDNTWDECGPVLNIRTPSTDEHAIISTYNYDNSFIQMYPYNTKLVFCPIYDSYDIYDKYDDLVNDEHILIVPSHLDTEEYWFQQSTVLDGNELFYAEFYCTLRKYDALKLTVYLNEMCQFIDTNKEVMDELVLQYDWSLYESD